MKKNLLLVTLLFCTEISFAQLQYTAAKAQNVAGTYTDLGTAGTVITTANFDDANSSPQDIGFYFYFNGAYYNQFVLNTNGFIKLGATAPATANIYSLLSASVTNTIAPFNFDLVAATGPEYRVETSGEFGSQVCTIQFKHLKERPEPGVQQQYDSINFQIKLYETTNVVEFIYGNFDPTANTPGSVTATCGLKGSSAANSVNAAKLSTTAWASAGFINGNYTSFMFNSRRDVLPPIGRTLRFTPFNDAKVDAVYTLGKIPRTLGAYYHQVSAKVRNIGAMGLAGYPVILNITGVNTFTDTQYVRLDVGDSANVTFNPASFWTTGTNTVTVSVQPDDVNSNNTATYSQNVNDSFYNYANASPATGRAGFNTSEGIVLAGFPLTGGNALVTGVKVYISNDINNIGQKVWGVVLNPASNTYQLSDSLIITAADTAKYKTFLFNTPVSYPNGYGIYVGLKQKINVLGHRPVGYQTEGPPSRSNAFFTDDVPYGDPVEFTAGRLMIEAIVKAGDAVPPVYQDETLLGWNFFGMNSPSSAAATEVHPKITSSTLLTRGSVAQSSPGSNSFLSDKFGSDGISTGNNDYFQFTVGVSSADTLSLSYINYDYLYNDFSYFDPNGIDVQFAYSLNGTSFTLIGTPAHLVYDTYYPPGTDVSNISALQNILNGTTVTFRMYVTGNTTNGVFGFTTPLPNTPALAIGGIIKTVRHIIMAAPVVPFGADFYLPACNSTVSGSINFTSTGSYPAGNVYNAYLNNSQWMYDTSRLLIGSLTSNANSGTINFTIPGSVHSHRYGLSDIWIESSAVPDALSVPTPQFHLTTGSYCYGPNSAFRSKQSGNWNDLNTWEMAQDGNGTGGWLPSTVIPDQNAYQVRIMGTDTVTVITPVGVRNIRVVGKLKVLNDAVNNGSLTFYENIYESSFDFFWTMTIEENAVLQVVSATAPFDSVIRMSRRVANDPGPETIRIYGKITVGDGSSVNGPGFYKFATDAVRKKFYWLNNSVFEWNTTSTNSLIPTRYFFDIDHAILRITRIGPAGFGGTDSTVINGTIEINTPVTMSGSGKKIFADGLKGSSTLTQAPGSGLLETTEAYTFVPPSPDNNVGAIIGIMDGTVTLNLSAAGLRLSNGITVTDSADVRIIGSGISYGKIEVQTGGRMTLDPASVLSIDNADLSNEGTIDGTGKIQFTGSDTSTLRSPGIINSKIELSAKQLRLDGNATTSSIDLLGGSHLRLDSFHLNMRTGNLVGDASNFIVTNDTGRVARYVAGADVPYHIGVDETSYTPVTITNTGTPDNYMVRVGTGIFKDSAITQGNVDRTWFVTDSIQGGSNVKLKMQWNSAIEQPGFIRIQSYISRLSVCPLPRNCSGSFFDADAAGAATNLGNGNYSRERSSIDSFKTNAFIVTSKPFVYTFTGNGNWTDSLNWTPGIPPPHIIGDGMDVIIKPAGAGECISNGNVQVIGTGRLTVLPGKKFRVTSN